MTAEIPQSPTMAPEFARRNFNLGVLNGVLYLVGDALLDPTLVLVAFISHLTPSAFLIGLVIPLRDSLWSIPQLWMSGYIQSLTHKLSIFKQMSVVRIVCWALMTLEINFVSDPTWQLTIFFILLAISSLASGISGLSWMEVVSKTIPAPRRGEFFALRMGIGGAINIGSSFFVRWILSSDSPLSFPYNFGLLSFLFFIFASIAMVCFNVIQEPADTQTLPAQPINVLIKRALVILKTNRVYRKFITLMSLMSIAGMATPFFAVYVQRSLGGDPSMIGIYLGVMIASNLAANVIFGRVSLQYGNRRVLTLSVISGICMSGLVFLLAVLAGPLHISPQAASLWLIPVFIFLGFRNIGYSIASNCILLEISPNQERSLYVGFVNTFTGFVLLLTGLSGIIKDLMGFSLFILLTLLAHIYSLYLTRSIKLKRNA